MPALMLAVRPLGRLTRLMRATTLGAMCSEYVGVAHGKGLPQQAVLWRHIVVPAIRYGRIPWLEGERLVGLLIGVYYVAQGVGSLVVGAAIDYGALIGVASLPWLFFIMTGLASSAMIVAMARGRPL